MQIPDPEMVVTFAGAQEAPPSQAQDNSSMMNPELSDNLIDIQDSGLPAGSDMPAEMIDLCFQAEGL